MTFSVGVITAFPELFEAFSKKGLIGQAIQNQKIEFSTLNPREFTTDLHKTIDDRPYGGGDGMIMLAEPLEKAVLNIKTHNPDSRVIYLSPQGEKLTDSLARTLATEEGIILICGRYGGVDERFITTHVDQEISVGDYILNGGEVGAMCVIEAVSRFLPGVLGNYVSSQKDSFSEGLLEFPQLTRPPEYAGLKVPAVLTSGDHKAIEKWRHTMSLLRTYFRRPELLETNDPQVESALKFYAEMSENDRRACGLPFRDTHLTV